MGNDENGHEWPASRLVTTVAVGLPFGLLVGVIIGNLLDHLALGIGIGLPLGVAIAAGTSIFHDPEKDDD